MEESHEHLVWQDGKLWRMWQYCPQCDGLGCPNCGDVGLVPPYDKQFEILLVEEKVN